MLIPHGGRPGGEIVAISGVEMNFFADSRTDINALEERYRTLFENIGVGMLCIAEDTTIALVNREFEKMTGYSKEQVEGKMSWIEFIKDDENLAKMKQYHTIRRIDPDTAPGVYDTKFETATGKILDVIVRVAMIPGTAYSIGSILDITERKIAENTLRESEEKYRTLVNNIQDSLYRTDLKGNLTFITPSGARNLGFESTDELIGMNVAEEFYENPGQRVLLLDEIYRIGKVVNYEVKLKRRDGTTFPALINSHLYYDEKGDIQGVEGILTDITQRKKIEEETRKLASIVRHSNELINLSHLDGRMVFLNEAGSRMLGIDQKDIEKINILQVIPDHIRGLVENELLPSLIEGKSWEGDLQYINLKTGRLTDVHAMAFTIDDPDTGSLKYLANVSQDITWRKVTEEKFTQVFMMAPDGISITRIEDGMIIDTNEAFEEMLGWKRAEVIGRTSLDINFWDDLADRVFMANELKAGREIRQRECRFRRKDNSPGIGLYSSKPIQIAGDECLIFIMQDITARRLAEESSRQSEEKFTKIFMLSPDCIAITRLSDGMIIDVNIGFEEITGWTREEATGKTSIDIMFWAGLEQRERMIDDLQAGREIKHREFQFRRKDGTVREGIYSARTIQIAGEECLIFILNDVTEIKETEKILIKNEQRLHGITTNIPGVVYQFYAKDNGEYGISYASERITEIFGLPGDLESIFPTFISRLCQEDKERFLNSIREAQEKIAPWNFEGRLLKPSGEIMWFKGLSTPVRSDDRVVFDGIFLDITEQKLAEEKSRQSEEKFTKVFMTTPDCIVITRLKDGQIMDVNRGFEEISGWKTHEVIGRTAMEINVWNDLVERDKMVNDLKADLDVLNRESRFRRKDGSLRNVNYSARRIKIAGDDCIIFVLQDITNLKEAERSLRSSLDEKELLIKELYHRTKNNMQVISGLLKLKSAGTDDQEIHDLFTDIETRIQTMALVHQKLYESQNLTDLNLHDFINSFAELITRNYALIPEKISIRQSVDSIPISIDVAMPLSLVLNELISNSLKHAFHGESHGEILIKIESAGKNLKFEYRDNGIGLPEGFEPSVSATLGMNIIHTISKNQLGGEIIFLKGKGFGCIINIKTNLYRRRI